MRRHALTDKQWEAIEPLGAGKEGDCGVTGKDNRLFVDAVVWIAKTGAPWRDLPERFGHWDTVYKRFNRWAKSGRWQAIFEALSIDVDPTLLMMDSTIVRAHQHAAGALKKGEAKHWVAPEEDSPAKSTHLETREAVLCALSSLPDKQVT